MPQLEDTGGTKGKSIHFLSVLGQIIHKPDHMLYVTVIYTLLRVEPLIFFNLRYQGANAGTRKQ